MLADSNLHERAWRDAAEKFIVDPLTIRFGEQIAIITNEEAAIKIFTL